jgi:hypothetical protein
LTIKTGFRGGFAPLAPQVDPGARR